MPWFLTPAVVTVAFLAAVLYALARVLRGTLFGGIVRGLSLTLAVVCGTSILSSLLLQQEELARVLGFLLPAVTVCLVVIFQPEIRRSLLRVGRPLALVPPTPRLSAAEEAVRAVLWLSRDRFGALIVWERGVGLQELVMTGIPMDAEMRAETLVSAFVTGSPLHDGAVVLRGSRIAAAGCTLPLSEVEREGTVGEAGFRHRAALGLSEQTDALVVVVSEETGHVSLARNGRLESVEDPRDLLGILLATPADGAPTAPPRTASLSTERRS
jgi:diadenylate cyclase